jgi:putative tryptophan/tyrosine transport system substrate-binding protein
MTGPAHKCNISLNLLALYLGLLVIALVAIPQARADTPHTAVLYPEIREPFRTVFTTIADGVSEALDGQVIVRPVRNEESAQSVAGWLREHGITSAVALGSRSQALSDELAGIAPVVIGAVHMSDELLNDSYYGIALNPDPIALFRSLKSLAPDVNRVHIVYHGERERWMIENAAAAARRLGITLNAIPVNSLQDAANSYREVLRSQQSNTDALWLSQDSAILDEQAVLPMILKEAWDRKLIVFSSNPSHVRRGVLFALYPDNHGMGRSLGAMSLRLREHHAHGRLLKPGGLRPLNDLLTAFNVRTAGRIGVRFSREDLNDFDLVFPPL